MKHLLSQFQTESKYPERIAFFGNSKRLRSSSWPHILSLHTLELGLKSLSKLKNKKLDCGPFELWTDSECPELR